MTNPILVGDRVYLSVVEPDEARELAIIEARETDTHLYPNERMPTSPIAFENLLRGLGASPTPVSFSLAVRLKADDRWIGSMNLHDIDWVNRTAETSSFMASGEFRSRGYGTEAKLLLLQFAFERLGIHVIISHVLETNPRSAAALLKQGYRPAGRVRYRGIKDGSYVDNLVFDITRDDWMARERVVRESK